MIDREEVMRLARDAWRETGEGWTADAWFKDRAASFERFAELVTEAANARENASWTLMCEEMVAAEREACAKVAETPLILGNRSKATAEFIAASIRARGNRA